MSSFPVECPVPFVDLTAQHRLLRDEIDREIAKVVEGSEFILGSPVAAFERVFSSFVGCEHAVGTSSGLDALRLALAGLGIGPGDEVVLPANTFIATALAVSAVGATPILVDCDPETYTIDVDALEVVLTPRAQAVIPVHLTGQPADMAPILALAQKRGLFVVEDAAQAHGATYRGKPCGSIGLAGCFSFYPAKNLGAFGDAGLVATNDDDLADRLRRLRNYGQAAKYEHREKGLNARMDTLQAAILNVKLPHLPAWNDARRGHAARYRELLAGIGDLRFQTAAPESTHVYHLLVVETRERDRLQSHLMERGIGTGIHYPIPIHLQEAYGDLGYTRGSFPVAERLASTSLSLPMYPELTEGQLERVAAEIARFFGSLASRPPGEQPLVATAVRRPVR